MKKISRVNDWLKKNVLAASSLLAVILVYKLGYGLKTLNPENTGWLMIVRHDWGTHYLGWFFYRNEPWSWPLGHISRYFYPIGTNIGFTDSIPLLALPFKLLAPLLPADFQYFGIWLFSCYLLTAWFTIRLLRTLRIGDLFIFPLVLFILTNPVLAYRGLHPALCAQWMLIASLYYYFRDRSPENIRKTLRYQFILLILSALTNPYLCMMILGFNVTLAIRLCRYDKLIGWKRCLGYLLGCAASLLFTWYVIGMISFEKRESLNVNGGYGLYGWNLNSLYNPFGWSSLVPQQKQLYIQQYEGFSYLGMGIFLMLAGVIVYLLIRQLLTGRWKQAESRERLGGNPSAISLTPLLILSVLMALFAISNKVSFGDKLLFTVPVPAILINTGEIFRASGRFFWILYYLIFLFPLVVIAGSRLRASMKCSLLVLALCIQLYDTKLLLTFRSPIEGAYQPPLDNNWNTLIGHFNKIIMYPPYEATYLTNMDYQDFSYLAAKAKKPINIGYVAREDTHRMEYQSDSLNQALEENHVDPGALYITTATQLNPFSIPLKKGSLQLNTLDNYYYLFSTGGQDSRLVQISAALNARSPQKLNSVSALLGRMPVFQETTPITDRIDRAPRAGSNAHLADSITYRFEKDNDLPLYLHVSGWAFIAGKKNNAGDSIFIFLNPDKKPYPNDPDKSVPGKSYIAYALPFKRPDITAFFKADQLDGAGFKAVISKEKLEPGSYQMGIAFKDAGGRWVYQRTGQEISGKTISAVPAR